MIPTHPSIEKIGPLLRRQKKRRCEGTGIVPALPQLIHQPSKVRPTKGAAPCPRGLDPNGALVQLRPKPFSVTIANGNAKVVQPRILNFGLLPMCRYIVKNNQMAAQIATKKPASPHHRQRAAARPVLDRQSLSRSVYFGRQPSTNDSGGGLHCTSQDKATHSIHI
jgi:hypothetical protein